ncbi:MULTISPECIES: tetratricopeptide repeat protein [Actinoplanes]|uniref:tetratricopeptide repeat protein n=1 Tax=Actinoplanes TaxID=1865 RepID=UPI000698C580|nr:MULTISPECIES: tetratricopeptide repeat protein [Actinoplanes]GLY04129.1 hypothetical protein Acsp01_45080 [Actinoplanes sp. NBRC 101535]
MTGAAAAILIVAGAMLPGGPPQEPSPRADGGRTHRETLTEHLQRVPGDWRSWAALGMSHVQDTRITGDPSHLAAADTALTRSLAIHPRDNADAHTGLGALAAARHDFAGALRQARQAVAADPYSADAYGVLTDAFVELGRYGEATDAVQRMLDLRPGPASFARASYLRELHGDDAEARELMRRALDTADTPDDRAFAEQHLGALAFGSGDLVTAASHYAAALRQRPERPALLAGRARVAAARGDVEAAATDLRAAVAILPAVEYLSLLSDVLLASGDRAGSAHVDELIRVGEHLDATTVDVDLVHFHADRGAGQRAVVLGRALLRSRPSVTVETAYAWALHSAGRDREALQQADRGLRLGTRDARAHFQRAVIRRSLGDETGAAADFHEAWTINPYFSLRHEAALRAAVAR